MVDEISWQNESSACSDNSSISLGGASFISGSEAATEHTAGRLGGMELNSLLSQPSRSWTVWIHTSSLLPLIAKPIWLVVRHRLGVVLLGARQSQYCITGVMLNSNALSKAELSFRQWRNCRARAPEASTIFCIHVCTSWSACILKPVPSRRQKRNITSQSTAICSWWVLSNARSAFASYRDEQPVRLSCTSGWFFNIAHPRRPSPVLLSTV